MDCIKIKKENILLEGITHPPLGEHRFIVYISESDSRRQIHVNADYYQPEDGIYSCYKYYDRGLCGTFDELRRMTYKEIEAQAYGAWMDGAR